MIDVGGIIGNAIIMVPRHIALIEASQRPDVARDGLQDTDPRESALFCGQDLPHP